MTIDSVPFVAGRLFRSCGPLPGNRARHGSQSSDRRDCCAVVSGIDVRSTANPRQLCGICRRIPISVLVRPIISTDHHEMAGLGGTHQGGTDQIRRAVCADCRTADKCSGGSASAVLARGPHHQGLPRFSMTTVTFRKRSHWPMAIPPPRWSPWLASRSAMRFSRPVHRCVGTVRWSRPLRLQAPADTLKPLPVVCPSGRCTALGSLSP